MTKRLILLSLLCYATAVFAKPITGDSLHYLLPKDTLFIQVGDFQDKYFEHKFAKKQTLFSMAKFYGIKETELNFYNPSLVTKAPSNGLKIKIPIPNRAIVRIRDKKFASKNHVPMFYIVKKSEGIKKIAEGYFNMPVDTLMARNKLKVPELKLGQKLLIGWMSQKGISADVRLVKGAPIVQKLFKLKSELTESGVGKKEYMRKGAAYWQKDSKIGGDLYAMHRICSVGSVIIIHNPMSNKTIYAKVVGKIPDGAYPANVEVVVSPTVAKLLGAIDPNFYVYTKFYK